MRSAASRALDLHSTCREHRYLPPPSELRSGPLGPPSSQSPGRWKPLHERRSLLAPFNLAITIAGAAAALAGSLLAAPTSSPRWPFIAIAGACTAAIVALASRIRSLATAAGAVVVVLTLAGMDTPRLWLGVLPWTIVIGIYAAFTAQSWYTLKHPFEDLVLVLRTGSAILAKVLLGRAAWDRLQVSGAGAATGSAPTPATSTSLPIRSSNL